EQSVHHAEDRGVRANPQRERGKRDERKSRRAEQHACREAKVLPEDGHGYSLLRTVSGSTRDAQRAGTSVAAVATATKNTATLANVSGSVAVTPNSSVRRTRVEANAAARPMASPADVRIAPSRSTRRSTALGPAPSAMRMPIS